MTGDSRSDLGRILKQQRNMIPLTLSELSAAAGVSSSHLGRIERGERFPSAHILRKIAKPLGFEESELLTLGGFLSPQPSGTVGNEVQFGRLDPYVASVLSQETVEVQRAIIGILSVTKSIAKSLHAYDQRNAEDQSRKS
ncbi:MAG: helix-turn-helix transcriptional regulator [Chloroflexota bacterium]